MDRSDTVEANLQMPTVTILNSRINRGLQLPSFFFSGVASTIPTFFIGLLTGAAGGTLLGATAVVLLQSVELLADNKLLMDQLEKYIVEYPFKDMLNPVILQMTSNDRVLNTYVCLLVEVFDVFSSTLSLGVSIFIGLSTYALVIKKYSEAAVGKALVLAGPVCLMCATLTGYILGFTLQSFLSITSSINVVYWFIISQMLIQFLIPIFSLCANHCKYMAPIIIWLFTSAVILPVFVIGMLVTTKLILLFAIIPTICYVVKLENTYGFQLIPPPVPLMLIITDVFNLAGQPIVNLQSPTSTNTSSAVAEGMFVGVLTSQMLTVAIGMSLFVSWQKGGAGKIYGSAAGAGVAALGAIKLALPVLGPGPTVGALTGVAGAVGVSLSAAVAITVDYGQAVDHYGLVGTLGVTLGAAAGAGLSSFAHSGLSGMFMGLCAATIPAGLHLEKLFPFLCERFQFCLRRIITIIIVVWLCFTGSLIFGCIFMYFIGFSLLFITVYIVHHFHLFHF